MKEESNKANLISALERLRIFAGFGGGSLWPSGEPERFSRARLGVLSRSSRKSLKRTKLKNSFRHAVQECQNRDPENMFSQATWKRLSLDVPSSLPKAANVDKSRREKGRKFSDWVFSKGNEARGILPFSDQSAYRVRGRGMERKEKEITPNWILVKCGLLFVMLNFAAHSVACNNNQRSLWGLRGVERAESGWIFEQWTDFICFLNQIIPGKVEVLHSPLPTTRLEGNFVTPQLSLWITLVVHLWSWKMRLEMATLSTRYVGIYCTHAFVDSIKKSWLGDSVELLITLSPK